jgi:CubicO group peptidase (beta-lactamase class C family)
MRFKSMSTLGLVTVWSVLVLAVVSLEALWFARPPVPPGDLPAIETHLVNTLSQATNRALGSAALVLLQNGEIVAVHRFGVADANTKAPVSFEQTRYQLASVSKLVTAWGVMKLVEAGSAPLPIYE